MNIKFYPTGGTDQSGEWVSNYSYQEGEWKNFYFSISKYNRKYRLVIKSFSEEILTAECSTIKQAKIKVEDFIRNFSQDDLSNLLSIYYGKKNSITYYKDGQELFSTWSHSCYIIEKMIPRGIYFKVTNDSVMKIELQSGGKSFSYSSWMELALG